MHPKSTFEKEIALVRFQANLDNFRIHNFAELKNQNMMTYLNNQVNNNHNDK